MCVRKELEKYGENTRCDFVGVFKNTARRVKISGGHYLVHCCIGNVVNEENGELLTHHVWVAFELDKIKLLNVKNGDVISFNAKISTYGNNECGVRDARFRRIIKRKGTTK